MTSAVLRAAPELPIAHHTEVSPSSPAHLEQATALRAETSAIARTTGNRRDDILVVAMNQGAAQEIESLRKWARVEAVVDRGSKLHAVRLDGRDQEFDLGAPGGIEGFVGTFGLPEDQQARVAGALLHCDADARDERVGRSSACAVCSRSTQR